MRDVLQWPVVGRDDLVSAFRPASRTGEEASFRALRARHLATNGVRVLRRDSGRLSGQFVVYSSLNVDAALLARGGNDEAGRRAAAAAERVEGTAGFARLRELLESMTGDQQQEVLSGRILGLPQSGEIKSILALLAQALLDARLTADLPSVADQFAGRVIERRLNTLVVRNAGGERTVVPAWMLESIHRDQLGDEVVLVTIRIDHQSAVFHAVPGIEIPEQRQSVEGGPPIESPYGRRDPRDLEVANEDWHLVTGEPEPLRILVPITIVE